MVQSPSGELLPPVCASAGTQAFGVLRDSTAKAEQLVGALRTHAGEQAERVSPCPYCGWKMETGAKLLMKGR